MIKAYQLKIMIKNSKPPIWRRCVVPAGITFSQLSMMLNEVMGWYGYHLFKYEFYHRDLEILEIDEDYPPHPFLDMREASATYINEYMESEKWFTYIYDFGDYWEHRVTIEEVITDYPYNYPQVLKFKGDCPMEDAGGLDSYYQHLEVLNDPSHPDHEAIKDWADNHPYYNIYELEQVNEKLKKYEVIYGRGDKRRQELLYKDFYDGKYSLKGSKSAKNNSTVVKSVKHQGVDKLQEMADLMNQFTSYKKNCNQKTAEG